MGKDSIKPSDNQMQNSYIELRPDTPLVEICDNKRVLIENHRGVICYGVKEIIVKVKLHRLSIQRRLHDRKERRYRHRHREAAR